MQRLPLGVIVTVLAILLFTTSTRGAAAGITGWTWDSWSAFDDCYRDRYLDNSSPPEPAAVRLVPEVLVSDDSGRAYNDFQEIRGKTQAKKILMIDDPDVTSALLMVGGDVGACEVVVNGTVLPNKPIGRTYWTGEFDRYSIPPRLLKKGANEFVFRAADPLAKGTIRIENSQWPRRSAVSHDAGTTWDFDHLADSGYCKGEYEIRLRLHRYAPQAWIKSPVVDLASADARTDAPVVSGAGRYTVGRLDVQSVTPPGTGVEAFVRVGATPDGFEENWGPWRHWPAERDQLGEGRFAQWRLVLSTSAAQCTPIVQSVSLVPGVVQASAANGPGVKSLRVFENANERIVRSSYDFAYADYDGNSRNLRDHFKLAQVMPSTGTEFEKLRALRQWTREQWKNGWDVGPLSYVPSWDARVILTMAPQKLSLGMCTHYATTFVQCSQALGYPSRSIFWGHALSESWSNQFKKWMVMDAGLDPNDKRRATYTYMRGDTPLNLMDVHRARYIDKKWDDIRIVSNNMSQGSDKPEPSLEAELGTDKMIANVETIWITLRNNYVDHRDPEEPEHGTGYTKYLGFLFWKDKSSPEIPWTDFVTTRAADMYWTLNQAQIHLRAPTPSAPHQLQVMLDTVTPNFAGYEYRLDDGKWVTWNAGQAIAGGKAHAMQPTGGCIELPWELHAGKNAIETRPFNKAGLRGIVSRMAIEAEM